MLKVLSLQRGLMPGGSEYLLFINRSRWIHVSLHDLSAAYSLVFRTESKYRRDLRHRADGVPMLPRRSRCALNYPSRGQN